MSLFLASMILLGLLVSGTFKDISPEIQLLSTCIVICGGLAGMGGGKHE